MEYFTGVRDFIENQKNEGNKIIKILPDGSEIVVEQIENIKINFLGDNNVVKVKEDIKTKGKISISMKDNCYVQLGNIEVIGYLQIEMTTCQYVRMDDETILRSCKILVGHEPYIACIIGKKCLISTNLQIRCSDSHSIVYVDDVKCSINKACYGTVIGDHVWIGQDVLVNKNTYIPDNCVVGARSLVSGKKFYSNCVLAGIPARIVRHNITWNRPAPHKLTKTSRQYQIEKKLAFKYRNEEEIKKGNRIICIADDGSEREVDINYFANLFVNFTGQYSLIKIHESVTIKKSLNIKIDDGGYCYIGEKCKFSSSKIVMSKDSTFVMGKSCKVHNGTVVFYVNGAENLEIIIGNNCLFATDIKLRVSDQYPIYSLDNPSVEINKPEFGIHIGNNVWICEAVKILKDVEIPNGCVIGVGSIVAKSNFCKNSLIAGVPAKICKRNILWKVKRI